MSYKDWIDDGGYKSYFHILPYKAEVFWKTIKPAKGVDYKTMKIYQPYWGHYTERYK